MKIKLSTNYIATYFNKIISHCHGLKKIGVFLHFASSEFMLLVFMAHPHIVIQTISIRNSLSNIRSYIYVIGTILCIQKRLLSLLELLI